MKSSLGHAREAAGACHPCSLRSGRELAKEASACSSSAFRLTLAIESPMRCKHCSSMRRSAVPEYTADISAMHRLRSSWGEHPDDRLRKTKTRDVEQRIRRFSALSDSDRASIQNAQICIIAPSSPVRGKKRFAPGQQLLYIVRSSTRRGTTGRTSTARVPRSPTPSGEQRPAHVVRAQTSPPAEQAVVGGTESSGAE